MQGRSERGRGSWWGRGSWRGRGRGGWRGSGWERAYEDIVSSSSSETLSQVQSISRLPTEMDSNSIPVLSSSDPAPINTLSTAAVPPAIEPKSTRPSAAGPTAPESTGPSPAGPTAPGPPSGATNPPGKTVEETIQPSNGTQPIGAAAAPSLSSSQAQCKPEKTERVSDGFTSDNNNDKSNSCAESSYRDKSNIKDLYERLLKSTRREDENRPLRSLDEDPDEKTEASHGSDPNWRWPAYDEVCDDFGNTNYAKRGKARKEAVVTAGGFPFQVIYRNALDIVLWPDTVTINLKSPHLLTILSKYLPHQKDLGYIETVEVDGRKVYVILEKLKRTQLSSNADEGPSAISVGLLSAKQGSLCQNDHNGVSNGVSHGKSNLAVESPEIHRKDLMSPVGGNHHGAGEEVVLTTERGSVSPSDQNGASHGVSNGNAKLATESSEIHSQDLVSPLEAKNHGAEKTAKEVLKEARLHLHHLVRFLEEEYAVVALRAQHMTEDKSVSFDMLWAFLTPGTTVVYYCEYAEEQLCGKVLVNYYEATQSGKVFIVTLDVWNYNGASYRRCAGSRVIGKFSGEKPFDTLGVFPIDKDRATSAETLKAKFLAKGRKFQELAMRSKTCFQHYNGATFRFKNNEIVKEKADGRVMVDLKSFAMMNPNYPLGTAKPPVASAAQASVEKSSQSEGEDENLIFAPAIVFGFSFTLKEWGAFAVTGFSEIDFDTTAFDALVMEPKLKRLLYSLVSQFVATRTVTSGPSSSVADLPRVDPIANKGEGCILLCYGPPGTGKTLTAESLAENLRRPLWSLSVAELGTSPGVLEKTLLKVLEIAAMWKAVLLLDEADVYLEKRVACTDLTRNAMTGVFLRLLEYHRGVLILTTNRITSFDDAFRSRISLVVCYPNLDLARREQIWRTALARVQAGTGEEVKVGPEFLADMARHSINGREIRNIIHIAQTLARSTNEELQERHVRLVMRVVTQTSETLDAALCLTSIRN